MYIFYSHPAEEPPEGKHKRKQKLREKKKHNSAVKVNTVDYESKSSGKDLEDDKKKSKKSKKQISKAKAAHSKDTKHDDVVATVVPNPHPDIGNYAVTTVISGSLTSTMTMTAVYTGILPVIPAATRSYPTYTSGFSPLPPLAAAATSLALTTTMVSASSTFASSTATSVSGHSVQAHAGPKHLPAVIVVLLTIGAAFLLAGILIVCKMCRRPRKHIPTPSLPILQDPFQDEKQPDPEEESLFGGKERTSARPGSDAMILPWTQYPHTSVAKPPPALDRQVSPPKRTSRDMASQGRFLSSSPATTTNHDLARTPNRLSVMSMSVYPGSPMSISGHGVGVAITGSPLTADGLPVLQRSNSKPPTRRMSKSGKNTRHSMLVNDKLYHAHGTDDSDLYSGADLLPPLPKSTATSSAGRARVKAPYVPESLLRASNTHSGTSVKPASSLMDEPNPFEDSQYVLPPILPLTKSQDRRERDTKALTNALGLASPNPVPPSPQTTVYPDDSITLAGDRRRSRSYGHGRAPSTVMSPTTEATARLGKLMLADFQSMVSLPSTKSIVAAAAPPATSMRKQPVTRKRVEELPPRVPSPPPLPSLAQMALAHTNPQDFEDYRSPTYSIYGLYEADRKSKNPGEGGY